MRKISIIALALFGALVYGKEDKCHIEGNGEFKEAPLFKICGDKKSLLTFDYAHFDYSLDFDVPQKQYAVIYYISKYKLTEEEKEEAPMRLSEETYRKQFIVLDYKNMRIFSSIHCLDDRIEDNHEYESASEQKYMRIINLKQYNYCSVPFNTFSNFGNNNMNKWEQKEDFEIFFLYNGYTHKPFAYTKDSPYSVLLLENPYKTPKNGLYTISFYNDKENIRIDTNFNALLQNKEHETIAKGKWKFKNCKKGTFSVSFDNNTRVDFIKIKNPNWYKDMTLKECLK
jgi:hypothetical protein